MERRTKQQILAETFKNIENLRAQQAEGVAYYGNFDGENITHLFSVDRELTVNLLNLNLLIFSSLYKEDEKAEDTN